MTYLHAILPLLIVALAIGAAGKGRWRRRILWSALAGLLLVSMPPVAALAAWTLEYRYPVRKFPPSEPQAIVVLSGNVYSPHPPQPKAVAGFSTYLRTRYAGWLFHHWRRIPVLMSGGVAGDVAMAALMKDVLVGEGVPPAMIWTDTAATSTYESAVYCAAILRERGIHRIALVTEAYHMLRSELVFRKQNIEVVPAPFAYRSRGFVHEWQQYLPDPNAILRHEDVLHEWIGLAWYRMRGRI